MKFEYLSLLQVEEEEELYFWGRDGCAIERSMCCIDVEYHDNVKGWKNALPL